MEVYRIPAYFGILIDYNIYCVENIAMNCQITIMIKNNTYTTQILRTKFGTPFCTHYVYGIPNNIIIYIIPV